MPTLDPRFNFVKVFRLWHETRLLNGYHLRMNADPGGIACDMEHSALLRRLLDGKPLLPEPPPRRWNNPDYELIELGFRETCNVRFDPLLIDQAGWEILSRDEAGYVVGYTIVDTAAVKDLAAKEHGYSLQRFNEERRGPLPYKLASTLFKLYAVGVKPDGSTRWRLEVKRG